MVKFKKLIPVQFVLVIMIATFFISFPAQAEGVKTEIISNFEVFDADIRDVYRSLAELGGINILMDPQVKGSVSIKLKHGLTIKNAIELLSQTYGYSFRWITQTRTVIIGNEKTFSNFESRETRIYHLNYADPQQVKEALKIIISDDKIGVDTRTNQLTIKASILEHQNIEELITRLDREMPQLNIEARIEEISKSASESLGLLWSFGETSFNDFKITATASIEALETKNQARMLANPNISVTDSQEGKILIGDKFPVITSSQTDSGITYSIDYIDIGTKLTVMPRINEEDIITVTLKAEVSSIREWRTSSDGREVPVIRTREASSVVRLREGETFVLSGLYETNTGTTNSGLPGLSQVPIIGRLFGKKVENDSESQVVIFLTPKIIRFKESEDQSRVKTIGKQEQPILTESPASKIEAETEIPAPIISTPTMQEGTSQPKTIDQDQSQQGTTGNQSSAIVDSTDSKKVNAPLQVEPVDKEVPVEEKPQADLGKLPKASEQVSEKEVYLDATVKPVNGVKVKIKAKKGETISSLAKKYGINKETILNENKLKQGTESIAIGTELVLVIPQNHFYEIKPKETLWRIAKRYGTTVELLMEINNITDYTKVEKGRAIILPVPTDKIADSNF